MSYQLDWQKKKVAQGKCRICGRRRIYKSRSCKTCYMKSAKKTKEYIKKNHEAHLLRMADWRRKNPDYQRNYRLKK
jgi:hypothetical protein